MSDLIGWDTENAVLNTAEIMNKSFSWRYYTMLMGEQSWKGNMFRMKSLNMLYNIHFSQAQFSYTSALHMSWKYKLLESSTNMANMFENFGC